MKKRNLTHARSKHMSKSEYNRHIKPALPMSNNTARKRPVPRHSGDFMAAVFPPEIFRIFSDDFRLVPAGKHRKLTGIHRKKSRKFPVGILPPLPAISSAFLQDLVTFPLLSCRFLRDPVAVIFDLGCYSALILRCLTSNTLSFLPISLFIFFGSTLTSLSTRKYWTAILIYIILMILVKYVVQVVLYLWNVNETNTSLSMNM